MPLSVKTFLQQHIEDFHERVKSHLLFTDVISIVLDENIDVNNMGRLAIVIRCASINNSKDRELFRGMKGTTKGTDVCRTKV